MKGEEEDLPVSMASRIACSAIGPWPWPIERATNLLFFLLSANLVNSTNGSPAPPPPGTRRRSRGEVGMEVSYALARCSAEESDGGSMKSGPNTCVTRTLTPGSI